MQMDLRLNLGAGNWGGVPLVALTGNLKKKGGVQSVSVRSELLSALPSSR